MQRKYDLEELASRLMRKRGLQPHFSKEALDQLHQIHAPARPPAHCEDLRSLPWCSIDNRDSRDIDQLTYAEKVSEDLTLLWVAIADVDVLVAKGSPIDRHAQINTTSVYTPAKVFSMLPEKLSTNLTSLNEGQGRLALVIKIPMNSKGEVQRGSISHAMVHNYAHLDYPTIGAWLEGKISVPEKVKKVSGLEEALLCQHEAAQLLKERRHALGALTLESPEVEAKLSQDQQVILELPSHNFADQLIEHFMIVANHVMATSLKEAKIPSLRRVVRIPKRWDRIRQIASALNENLPKHPDSKALDHFLLQRRRIDPESFPDLSLTVIKLLGRGEYIVESHGALPIGHFGLALSEYMHSTAPNRRYPDLISQRQYKAFLNGKRNPYPEDELRLLAAHCTMQEDAAIKVERHMNKSAAALLLSLQIGTIYQGIITGAGAKGTWVRILKSPIEGRVVHGFKHLDVGDRLSVQLVHVDIPKGFIDFAAVH